MKITVNGIQKEVTGRLTVTQYLEQNGYEKTLVLVEHNFKSSPREQWNEIFLDEGDNLEIIRFIGGG